jgi:flagellar L-ring protein precursor FlgH
MRKSDATFQDLAQGAAAMTAALVPPPSSTPRRARPAPALRLAALALAGLALAGCNAAARLSQVGQEPPQSAVDNPARLAGEKPVEMPMPMPRQDATARHPNSLWSAGTRAFFKDQRASDVGDILTVVIDIQDGANLNNQTSRSRNSSETAGLGNFLGLESQLDNVLPDAVDNENLVNAGADSVHEGTGSVQRQEDINLRIATLVTQVLPNGNLVVAGRQEVRVNYENRILQVAGVIRPEDIASTNEISYDDIAEARIAYGGEGQITDVQQPRYGQQIYDILFPF